MTALAAWALAAGLAMLTPSGGAQVEARGPACAGAMPPLDRLICADDSLAPRYEMLNQEFTRSLSRADAARRVLRESRQRDWLASRASRCALPEPDGSGLDAAARQCLGALYDRRIGIVSSAPGTEYREDTPTTRAICEAILAPTNVRWMEKQHHLPGDSFAIVLPSQFGRPAWTPAGGNGGHLWIHTATFDFTNSGLPSLVFGYFVETPTFTFTWHIVVAPGEEAELRSRLATQPANAWIDDLARRAVVPGGSFPSANPAATGSDARPRLRSQLYDASGTELYEGWYTASQAFLHEGTTYLLVESVNNLHGPTAAIFRPGPGLRLDPVCLRIEPPSRLTHALTIDSGDHPCPAPEAGGATLAATAITPSWTRIGERPWPLDMATIALPEWPSPRRIFSQTMQRHRYSIGADLYVEREGADALAVIQTTLARGEFPGNDVPWEPLGGGDTSTLFQTARGTYVVIVESSPRVGASDPPLGTTWHKLLDGTTDLERVCTVADIYVHDGDDPE